MNTPIISSLAHMPQSWTDETVSALAITLILLINTITDLHHRQVILSFTVMGAMFGLAQSIATGRSPADLIPALFPGLFLIAFSLLTSNALKRKSAIGCGDGIVITALGFFMSPLLILSLCAFAFLIAAVPAGILLIRRHRKTESMPFLPFLLTAWGILLIS